MSSKSEISRGNFICWSINSKKYFDRISTLEKYVGLKMCILEQWMLQANILVLNLQPILNNHKICQSIYLDMHWNQMTWEYYGNTEIARKTLLEWKPSFCTFCCFVTERLAIHDNSMYRIPCNGSTVQQKQQ